MNRVSNLLVIVVIAALGIWGCSQTPAPQNAGNSERVKGLEREVAQLQDAYRSLSSTRDQLRKKLADVEEDRGRLQTELDQFRNLLDKEREELKSQLASRTVERDAALAQFDQFRKGVRSLLLQADSAMNPAGSPDLTLTSPASIGHETAN